YHNWEDRDRGALTLREAIEVSCNTFFYQLGLKVGPERILQMAAEFGLGRLTGSGLPGERSGLVPTPDWKRRGLHDRWHPGDTVSLSIGQGLLTVTPLQMARMMAVVANGGTVWRPRLVERVESPTGDLLRRETETVQGHVELAPVVYDFLRQALV